MNMKQAWNQFWQVPYVKFWFAMFVAPLLVFWSIAALVESWRLFWLVMSDGRTTIALLFLAAGLYYLTTRSTHGHD